MDVLAACAIVTVPVIIITVLTTHDSLLFSLMAGFRWPTPVSVLMKSLGYMYTRSETIIFWHEGTIGNQIWQGDCQDGNLLMLHLIVPP